MAAGHWDYARYIAWFLQQRLPAIAELPFIMVDHVCRHSDGPWNGVSTDQFGDRTCIRYGKSKGGLVGISLSEDQVAGWVLSNHVCNMLSLCMDNLFTDSSEGADIISPSHKHKEETPARVQVDLEDRKRLR